MNVDLDSYALRAKLWPALVAGLPAVLAATAWFPLEWKDWEIIGGCVAFFGLLGVLEHLGRERGFHLQPDLFRAWDGPPTTRYLRHRDSTLNPLTKSRYRETLAAAVPVGLPTAESESLDPEGADRIYESCGQFLRAKTRKKDDHPLVFAKNVEYGFRRNCLGLRSPAIWIGAAALAAVALRPLLPISTSPSARVVAAVTGIIDCLLLLWWVRTVGLGWVKSAADSYAEALLATCDLLPGTKAQL